MFGSLFASKKQLNNQFEAAWKKGDLNKALKLGRKLINKDNNDYKNLNTVAMVHYELGYYEHALNYLLKANILCETTSHWQNLGKVQQALNNHERAIKSYNKALEITPNNLSTWFLLAQCYKELGDLKSACHILTKLILVYPENFEARIDLGLFLLLRGKVEKGKKHFERVLSCSNNEKVKLCMLKKLHEYRHKFYIQELASYYTKLSTKEKSLT